jgi:hypothetical protein
MASSTAGRLLSPESNALPRRVLADPKFLDELLQHIQEGGVIPVVGPELVTTPHGGASITLVEHLARRVADDFDLTSRLPPAFTLSDVVAAYKRDGDPEEIYARVLTFLKDEPLPIPPALLKLAGIRHFNLFVSTTFDTLLKQAVDEVRFGNHKRTREIVFSGTGNADLDPGWTASTNPIVYYLFGRASAGPNYVLTEEDTLEFLYALSAPHTADLLFEELEQKHLLVLGCGFPDWLTRFFIRLAKRKRLSAKSVSDLLADSSSRSDSNLVLFLDHFSRRTRVYPGTAAEFVDELWRRWHERFGEDGAKHEALDVAGDAARDIPDDAIFISYARQDMAAADELWSGLKDVTDIWMDRTLEPGDDYALLIKRRISRCSLFVPIISANTIKRSEGFFHREWNQAVDRLDDMAQGRPFVIPVIIDDTPEGVAGPPAEFWRFHASRLPGGRVTPEFIHQVMTGIRRVRGAERIHA